MGELRVRVQSALTSFIDEQVHGLGDLAADLAPITGALSRLAVGGKGLRPAFCYWACVGLGGSDSDALVRAAASLELLQACALVHDDLMDRSDIRRGQPAAHLEFAAQHARRGWEGDPAVFGTGTAVLLGDLALAWCDQMLTGCGLPAESLARARPAFNRMRTEMVAGQYLDLLEAAKGGCSVAGALRVVAYKTVRYTVEGPLQLGAALAGSPAGDALSAYGIPLGEAFQLRDDLLGVFGDPNVTGKPAGDDLREGKRSVLLALASARGADLTGIGGKDPDLPRLRRVLIASGAVAQAEEMIGERTAAAVRALRAVPLTARAAHALQALAVAATDRAA